jgi:2-succinyl-5-enolpyruvyl-6-hydroxy-3-cyclohexene-1-carboxylate synthase
LKRDVNTGFAVAVVDEWVRTGVAHACIAPGSRSTPMALALARDGRIAVHVFLDERSAAFAALGVGRATGRPAVVLCTSGTAAANFHPAVLEADLGRVPLVVATADRPAELRRVGAAQTADQTELFGSAVRWFVDLGAPDEAAAGAWRSTAARVVATACGAPAGPVHWNLPFREPLVPTGAPPVDAPGRADGAAWTVSHPARRVVDREVTNRIAALVRHRPRGVIVAGWGASAAPDLVDRVAALTGWPVLADPVSNLRRGPFTVSTYDALARSQGFVDTHRPDVALRIGAPTTGRPLDELLRGVPLVVVDPDGAWGDPGREAVERVTGDADAFLRALAVTLGEPRPDLEWFDRWRAADDAARQALDALLDEDDAPFEGRVARDVADAVPTGGSLVVASSMPVRDLESFMRPREGIRILSNRGLNGIDGFVSTAIGVALGNGAPTVALLGDLCFLHDGGGLLGAASRDAQVVFVVLDNGGGGIFSFLPQATAAPEHFETLFATPQGVDISAFAAVHGLSVVDVTRARDVDDAVRAALDSGGVRVVHVRTGDRTANVERHRAAWGVVERAVGAITR